MLPILEHLPLSGQESFFAKAFELPYFSTPWHYHPEFELVLVVQSRGKRFIGNAVSDFQEGDLSFLGSNLPHLYRNPSEYYEENTALLAKSIVIHFQEKSIGHDFLALPQSLKLRQLLERSRQGIDLLGTTRKEVSQRMYALLETEGLARLIRLLEILNMIAESSEYRLISETNVLGHNVLDSERLSRIFDHILHHFQQEIRLEEVAGLIHMTPTSFCRFFRERTKRSFSSYLMEVRLDHAARLLRTSNCSIVDIGYQSGYNNLSNFNRQFRNKFSLSPRQYRRANMD